MNGKDGALHYINYFALCLIFLLLRLSLLIRFFFHLSRIFYKHRTNKMVIKLHKSTWNLASACLSVFQF